VLGDDRHPLPDPVARRPLRHVLTRELHRAVAGTHDAEDRLERRRLARRVPAEPAAELAPPPPEAESLEDVDRPVERVDGVEAQERRLVAHLVVVALAPRYA